MFYDVPLPKRCDEDLAYFCGLIVGDGSLPFAFCKRRNELQKRHIIYFCCDSIEFIEEVYAPLFQRLFKLKPRIVLRKEENKKNFYNCVIESKKIYNFLVDLGIQNGKKAKIAKVPKIPKKYFSYFLAGLLDTDGGKKGSGFGLSTSSPYLAKFCIMMFKKFNFSFHSCPWVYNNYIYHQIYIYKRDFNKILKNISLKNKQKIDFITKYASVA